VQHPTPPVCTNLPGSAGAPGSLGILPELLNEVYGALHELLGALGGNSALLGKLSLAPPLVTEIDTLLEQLLVSQKYPCDGGKTGLVPDALDNLYKLLNSLLASNGGDGILGGLGDLGLIPDILNKVTNVLRKILSSRSGAGGSSGTPGTVPQLLDALDNLLRELLSSQQARCGNPPGCVPPRAVNPISSYKYCYSKHRGYYLCRYRPHRPAPKPVAPKPTEPVAGSPGSIGLLPELLNDLYDLIHEILGALGGLTALLGKLDVAPSLLTDIDALLEQLLVSQKYPCDSDPGVVPKLLNTLVKVLRTLLATDGGDGILGGVGDLGLVPKLLNALVELLEDLLSSNAGAGGAAGGKPGAVPELLDALVDILEDLLASHSAKCPSAHSPHYSHPARSHKYYVTPKPAPTLPPAHPAGPTDVVGILITLLKELVAAKVASGEPIDEGVVPQLLDVLSSFLTDLISSQGTASSGEIPEILNALSDVLERLLASRARPGGSPGLVDNLLKTLRTLLKRLLASKAPPSGKPGVVPAALDDVSGLLDKLLAS